MNYHAFYFKNFKWTHFLISFCHNNIIYFSWSYLHIIYKRLSNVIASQYKYYIKNLNVNLSVPRDPVNGFLVVTYIFRQINLKFLNTNFELRVISNNIQFFFHHVTLWGLQNRNQEKIDQRFIETSKIIKKQYSIF